VGVCLHYRIRVAHLWTLDRSREMDKLDAKFIWLHCRERTRSVFVSESRMVSYGSHVYALGQYIHNLGSPATYTMPFSSCMSAADGRNVFNMYMICFAMDKHFSRIIEPTYACSTTGQTCCLGGSLF
jgi:hypothetical protein